MGGCFITSGAFGHGLERSAWQCPSRFRVAQKQSMVELLLEQTIYIILP